MGGSDEHRLSDNTVVICRCIGRFIRLRNRAEPTEDVHSGELQRYYICRYMRGAGTGRSIGRYNAVRSAHMARYENRHDRKGQIFVILCNWHNSDDCRTGDNKHCRCYQFNAEHRYADAVHQLRRHIACGYDGFNGAAAQHIRRLQKMKTFSGLCPEPSKP